MDGKTKALLAHITIIGWIVALVLNQEPNKDPMASFYIRQVLGIYIVGIVISFIPVVGWILWLAVFVFWLLSLIYSIQGTKKEVPLVGEYFQDWFKAL